MPAKPQTGGGGKIPMPKPVKVWAKPKVKKKSGGTARRGKKAS